VDPTLVMQRLVSGYGAARDPGQATAMRAYLRDQFPFLGIRMARRRELSRQVLSPLTAPTENDLKEIALACWQLPEREYQYFACDLLRRHARIGTPDLLVTVRTLIVEKSWWDTVDALAVHVVGPIVARHPATVSTMDAWSADENLWLARTAILHQLTYKAGTDPARLFRYCSALAGHRDFFIRKAIGWALREYAKTDPAAVRQFVAVQRARLAPLSVREALKNIDEDAA
jgi:3-methyladenine DNA glycosylase AlkD